ncbi:hypothetical protein CVT25_003760 [Psilocybe cyanescens]|uniref:Uncharacterized protein n=1 Tax=Psilocybe cyanescens TaxID=93625 RepID=A0A409XW47_PSICY|nr:hypothetical protein CVT25_003760 [Psilocybe cyanescens]
MNAYARYLYTGKDCGKGFEFLFDSSDVRERSPGGLISRSVGADSLSSDNPEFLHIEKLRKDFVLMWCLRLYLDVRIALTSNFGGHAYENMPAIFSSRVPIFPNRARGFEAEECVEWVMAAVLRGVREPWAPALYQGRMLFSCFLLRPHPTDPMVPVTSHVHMQVEQARIKLLK